MHIIYVSEKTHSVYQWMKKYLQSVKEENGEIRNR